jgi:hypothetical protein
LAKLRAALNDSSFDPSGPVPAEQQEAALALLLQPDYVGCPHIRLMMLKPTEYEVRTEITQWYLAAFYDFMWNHEEGSKFNHITDLEELDGAHNERAVVRLFPNYQRVVDTNSDVRVSLTPSWPASWPVLSSLIASVCSVVPVHGEGSADCAGHEQGLDVHLPRGLRGAGPAQ